MGPDPTPSNDEIAAAAMKLVEAIAEVPVREMLNFSLLLAELSESGPDPSGNVLKALGKVFGAVMQAQREGLAPFGDNPVAEAAKAVRAEADTMGGHLTKVLQFKDDAYSAACHCGFLGESRFEYEDASVDASEHLVEAV